MDRRELQRILIGQDGPCGLIELLRFQVRKAREEKLNPDRPYTWQDFSREKLESKIDALEEKLSPDGEDFDPRHPAKGDLTLIGNRESVNFRVAERYAGIGPRRRQQAIAEGKLTMIGAGKNRRVTVESLVKYQPPLKDAK